MEMPGATNGADEAGGLPRHVTVPLSRSHFLIRIPAYLLTREMEGRKMTHLSAQEVEASFFPLDSRPSSLDPYYAPSLRLRTSASNFSQMKFVSRPTIFLLASPPISLISLVAEM